MPHRLASIDDTTVPPSEPSGTTGKIPFAMALVIVWYPADPSRVGEIAFTPDDGSKLLIGRLDADPANRASFHQQRPGGHAIAAPLLARGISRRHLFVSRCAVGLTFQRVPDSTSVTVEGQRVDGGVLMPGDCILVGGEMLLMCVLRPRTLMALSYFPKADIPAFGQPDRDNRIGESALEWGLRETVARVAKMTDPTSKTSDHILLFGETGVGKELVAHALHRLSDRANGPFVDCDAGAISPGLIASELSGSPKNYPNPGMDARIGLFPAAHLGWLFIDEIGKLDLKAQAALLCMLATGRYLPLGAHKALYADVRAVAATNRDPDDPAFVLPDVRKRFVLVRIPSLRDRPEDIPLIVRELAKRYEKTCKDDERERLFEVVNGELEPKIDPVSLEAVLRSPPTGNVRELEQMVWAAVHAPEGERVAFDVDGAEDAAKPLTPQRVVECLRQTAGNKTEAARALGMSSRYVLIRWMKKMGIETGE